MLKIEVASDGYQREQFERELRLRFLALLTDLGAKYTYINVNRVQFIKPNKP